MNEMKSKDPMFWKYKCTFSLYEQKGRKILDEIRKKGLTDPYIIVWEHTFLLFHQMSPHFLKMLQQAGDVQISRAKDIVREKNDPAQQICVEK